MAIILYEGFNLTTTDTPNLNPKYWSTNNPANIQYGAGRTNNELSIVGGWQGGGNQPEPENLNRLTLSNFSDPLLTDDCFALGFSHAENSLKSDAWYFNTWPFDRYDATLPWRVKYMEFKNSSNSTVLTLNLIHTRYNNNRSLGLEVVQNNSVVTVYDFRSYIGHSWTFEPNYWVGINTRTYLEIFIDAKNTNKMSVRVSQDGGTIHGYLKNSSGQIETPITGFSSLGSISWFGNHNGWPMGASSFKLDDLYFSKGSNSSECYLGANTRIYRLALNNTTSTAQWLSNNTNAQHTNLNSSDGDSNYIYSSATNSGATSLFDLDNLPNTVPTSNVSITVMPINTIRKTGDIDGKFINVMTSGTGGSVVNLGPEQNVTLNSYDLISSLITINPITGNPWTINDINNMQIGIKNLGPLTP